MSTWFTSGWPPQARYTTTSLAISIKALKRQPLVTVWRLNLKKSAKKLPVLARRIWLTFNSHPRQLSRAARQATIPGASSSWIATVPGANRRNTSA